MIDVFYLSLKAETPCNSYWDYTFLNDFIDGKSYKPHNMPEFNKQEVNKLKKSERAIVILPARHHAKLEQKVNKELEKIDKVCLFLMGDEEADFDVEQIDHNDIMIWVQNPHPGKHDKYNKLGTGYAPMPKLKYKEKTVDVFFSGQITHERRKEMMSALDGYKGTKEVNGTKGFTQGYELDEYYEKMNRAKYAPCPSGAVIPDSFRLHEALQTMCIPLADDQNSQGTIKKYWEFLYPDAPLIVMRNWTDLSGYIEDTERNYHRTLFSLMNWWFRYKRDFAYKVTEFINE